jgi:hypothetical protein
MNGLCVIQERRDKNPTLAYEYKGEWHSYSNHKLVKFRPKEYASVENFDWHDEPLTSYVRGSHFLVYTQEGNMVLAKREGSDWFSLHTGRRLLVNVIRWARVTWTNS